MALATLSYHGVELWHLESGQLLFSLPEQDGLVYNIAWSPNGRRLAVSRSNGDIDIWNIMEMERMLDKVA